MKNKTKKTQKEIDAEIKRLEALVGKLRHSAFGDNHNDAVAAQIDVLKGEVSESNTYTFEDDGEWRENVASAARDAFNWMNGDAETATLSEEWEPLKVGGK